MGQGITQQFFCSASEHLFFESSFLISGDLLCRLIFAFFSRPWLTKVGYTRPGND